MKYFILRDDQVTGPFSKQQVLAGIKSKKLRKTDLLGTSVEGPWQKVEDAVGTKNPKASTAKQPVESEAQNKQGNASAGEVDDSWDSADDFGDSTDDFGDLPDLPDARTFYIERNKKVAGPYSVKQIEAAIRSGKMREADSFSDLRTGPWRKLRAFYRTNGQIRNELTYVVKSQFFFRKKKQVSYQCPRCDASLWNSLSEAGNDDSCPECQTQFSVPGTDALKDSTTDVGDEDLTFLGCAVIAFLCIMLIVGVPWGLWQLAVATGYSDSVWSFATYVGIFCLGGGTLAMLFYSPKCGFALLVTLPCLYVFGKFAFICMDMLGFMGFDPAQMTWTELSNWLFFAGLIMIGSCFSWWGVLLVLIGKLLGDETPILILVVTSCLGAGLCLLGLPVMIWNIF